MQARSADAVPKVLAEERLHQIADRVGGQTRILEGKQASCGGGGGAVAASQGTSRTSTRVSFIPMKKPFRRSSNTQVGAGTKLFKFDGT